MADQIEVIGLAPIAVSVPSSVFSDDWSRIKATKIKDTIRVLATVATWKFWKFINSGKVKGNSRNVELTQAIIQKQFLCRSMKHTKRFNR